MKRVSVLTLVALTVLLATSAWAQMATEPVQGTVVRVDQVERIVMLEDGRMYRVIETTEIVVNEKPATIMALEPGQRVIIRNGQAVVVSDNAAALVREPPPIIEVGARDPWCQGAWDPARGTNFGSCAMPKPSPTR
jgi:hypothetical protein